MHLCPVGSVIGVHMLDIPSIIFCITPGYGKKPIYGWALGNDFS